MRNIQTYNTYFYHSKNSFIYLYNKQNTSFNCNEYIKKMSFTIQYGAYPLLGKFNTFSRYAPNFNRHINYNIVLRKCK